MNQCYHDVATQVNMDDVSGQRLGVGMATRGPSFGHRYVDPSPIARHVVDGDAIEGTNLELHDDTLFLYQFPCTPPPPQQNPSSLVGFRCYCL